MIRRFLAPLVIVALLLAAACAEEDSPARAPGGDASDQTPPITVADTVSPVPNTATAALPTVTLVPVTPKPQPTSPLPPPPSCHPSYQGACLDPNASDYDCAGGSGNGPKYTGRVAVVGPDVFDLDRDGDGIGCE
jgi:hypothetical protein